MGRSPSQRSRRRTLIAASAEHLAWGAPACARLDPDARDALRIRCWRSSNSSSESGQVPRSRVRAVGGDAGGGAGGDIRVLSVPGFRSWVPRRAAAWRRTEVYRAIVNLSDSLCRDEVSFANHSISLAASRLCCGVLGEAHRRIVQPALPCGAVHQCVGDRKRGIGQLLQPNHGPMVRRRRSLGVTQRAVAIHDLNECIH